MQSRERYVDQLTLPIVQRNQCSQRVSDLTVTVAIADTLDFVQEQAVIELLDVLPEIPTQGCALTIFDKGA